VAESLRKQLQREGSLIIDVKVIPRAQKSEVIGLMPNGALKVKVAAVPEKREGKPGIGPPARPLLRSRKDSDRTGLW
jgi:hypothetical protein